MTVTLIEDRSRLTHASSYKVHGPGSLLGLCDKTEHAQKKKIFIQGFSDAAIREHEPKVVEIVETFCEKLLEDISPATGWTDAKNLTDWCEYLNPS